MNEDKKGKVAIVVLLIITCTGVIWSQEPVSIPDAVLKEAVEDALWITDPMPDDMLGLVSLTCVQTFATQGDGIQDLTGLSSAANLQTLNLRLNWISNLSPLASLTNLETLNLSQNRVSDLSPLSGLTSLRDLNVHGNRITDLSAVSGLTNLQDLNIRINDISDLTPLASLTALTTLDAKYADISDLSGLANLTNLTSLTLPYNEIRSVTPLAGLHALERLYLQNNHITDISFLIGLPNLEVVDLQDNDLNEQAYTTDLEAIAKAAPGVCIKYNPNSRLPGNIQASDGTHTDNIRITWDGVPNGPSYTTYYRVARSTIDSNKTVISQWQTATTFADTTAKPDTNCTYWVQTATSAQGDNESAYSTSDTGWSSSTPTLTVSSTPGGSVVVPGEGVYVYDTAKTVSVVATEVDSTRYVFTGFTGTAVEAGKVADPGQASTSVRVDGAYTLRAHFAATLDTLYVDSAANDSFEDGTPEAPFDTIQEAIDVAPDGVTIVVRYGTYGENLDFAGRNVHLTGIDPDDPDTALFPIIDGNNEGTVLSFTQGEDPNCTVTGFVLTGGKERQAGAIFCETGSPTISHCLIVGNRTDAGGAAVYCCDSTALFSHCTIADNYAGDEGVGFHFADSDVAVINSIVWTHGGNAIDADKSCTLSIGYSDIKGGWAGLGNIDEPPLFARFGTWIDPGAPSVTLDPSDDQAVWVMGDYHLQSQAGRWDPETQTRVLDEVTSPCIDAGDPLSPVGGEPAPNGNNINIGAYGGLVEASFGR